MSKKNFSKSYIEAVEKKLHNAMYETPGSNDFVQLSLSVRQAMLSAATVFGSYTDEQKHNLNRFLTELVVGCVLPNSKSNS